MVKIEGEYIVLKILSLKLAKLVFHLEKAEQILLILAVLYRTKIKGEKKYQETPKPAKTPKSSFYLPEMSLESPSCDFCKL